MEDWLTASQLIRAAAARGIPITARTLRLYASMGLIPRPQVRPGAAGGRTGYYSPRVLDLLAVVEKLKDSGRSLEQAKEFLDRLTEVARLAGRDPLDVQAEALDAITTEDSSHKLTSSSRSSFAFLRSLGGRVTAEMVKHGVLTGENVTGMDLVIQIRDNETVSIPLYLDPDALETKNPTTEADDRRLASVVSAYYAEVDGQPADIWSPEVVRRWLETTYDMSRSNLIMATRPSGPVVGFVALGVEPERLRAGQVRLEGPYSVPEYRGQGIGAHLLRLAEDRARALGATYIDSFKDSGASTAISFLKHSGFSPEFYEWVARAQVRPTAAADYEKAVRGKKAFEIRPLQKREDLDFFAEIRDRVAASVPGHYKTTADDLVTFGFALPAKDHFLCTVNGEYAGVLWQSTGSSRIYVAALPAFAGTWVESAMWKYLLNHAADQRLAFVTTEAVSATGEQSKTALSLGFSTQKMLVCYRKRLEQ